MSKPYAKRRAAILVGAIEYPALFDFHEELLDCICRGDGERLEKDLNEAFDDYQNSDILDVEHARNILVLTSCLKGRNCKNDRRNDGYAFHSSG